MLRAGLTALAVLSAAPALATGLDIEIAGQASGTIHIDLLEDVAPKHVAQITALAEDGFYDGVVFHRVIDGFIAQTGDGEFGRVGADLDMRNAGTGGSDLANIPAEFSDLPFERGTVGMARAGSTPVDEAPPEELNSANSQFFIMFAPGAPLNGSYTVIGQVTEGMDVVDDIKRGTGDNGAVIGEPDRIVSMKVTE